MVLAFLFPVILSPAFKVISSCRLEATKGMHGDRALVHVTHHGGEGRAEGEIIRILRRAHITVVGEFRIKKRGNYVISSDERVQQWIEIPEGMEIPPTQSLAGRGGIQVLTSGVK